MREIEDDVLTRLHTWNAPPQNDNLDMDFRFALAAFLSIVSPDEILTNHIDPNAMEFVLGDLNSHAFLISKSLKCNVSY